MSDLSLSQWRHQIVKSRFAKLKIALAALPCLGLMSLFGNLTAGAFAELALVELDDPHTFWTNSEAPPAAVEILTKLSHEPKADLRCFAFAENGDWVLLSGARDFYGSNLNLPICQKLHALQETSGDFKCVAFAPGGGWTILHGAHGSYTEGQVPEASIGKIEEIGARGGELRSIAYGPQCAWVLLHDKTGVAYGGVPKELGDFLDATVEHERIVRFVAFTGPDWVCVTDHGWRSSNDELAVARRIGDAIRRKISPKWIARSPTPRAHDFSKWLGIIQHAYHGKLAGGYGFQVSQHGKVVLSVAEGWARAPWEKDHPSEKWTMTKPMPIASISKTITGVALLKLWEQSGYQFSLDAPVWPYLGKLSPTAHEDVKRVTFRQLLTHRSGFNSTLDATADLQKFLNSPLVRQPGGAWEYDDNNFYLLRLLIEQIANEDYTSYVKKNVLEPMGIRDMETHAESIAPMCGYQKAGDRTPGFPFAWDQAKLAGAAGWWASVADLGKFLNGLRDHKVLNTATTQIMYLGVLGWDGSDPCYEKVGAWEGSEGNAAGRINSAIAHFPDDIDAVLLVNCDPPSDLAELLEKAWAESSIN
jgi:CubicO group peptidase (beta-lactamase class C family)